MRIGVTGATGFIGRHLTEQLKDCGHEIVILSRRPIEVDAKVRVVVGSLQDRAALENFVSDVDAIIHIAGIVRATNVDLFREVNAAATEQLALIARDAGCQRFLLVSSLSARSPEVSQYAASKRLGEELAAAAFDPGQLVIVRPPAVYGPGDEVTLPIFKQICAGLLFAPRVPGGRFSMIYVRDLARLLATVVEAKSPPFLIEPDDGHRPYSWQDIADIAGEAAGVRVRTITVPRWLLAPVAHLSDLAAKVLRRPMMLSGDKLGELFHRDWRSSGAKFKEWAPEMPFSQGAETTIAWYRKYGWIGPSAH